MEIEQQKYERLKLLCGRIGMLSLFLLGGLAFYFREKYELGVVLVLPTYIVFYYTLNYIIIGILIKPKQE